MGIFSSRKRRRTQNEIKINIDDNQFNHEQINDDNILFQINEKPEEKPLCMKIYLCGNGKGKNALIDNAFKDSILDPYFKTIADKEFKTDQFHWILRVYCSENLDKDICEKITHDIVLERNQKIDENTKKLLRQTIIICFDDSKLLCDYFEKMKNPKIILVTQSKSEIKIDKRFVTNIITENMKDNDVCSQIISTLWEIDCYFNERDNKICRYSPENIFKELEKENSLFSINILLTGLRRVGKSTFINLLAGKMIAFESDDNNSVTKKITEYYIYNKEGKKKDKKEEDKKEVKKEGNSEHGAIKLIDTPGLIPYTGDKKNVRKDYLYEEGKVMNMIKNNKNEENLLKKIHFILFISFENGEIENLEGDNIKKLFENLRDCNCPVYFLVNGVGEDFDIGDHIDGIREGLGLGDDFDNLLKEDNFILSNFKQNDTVDKIYGINKVYEKILNYITEKNTNIKEKHLEEKMNLLIKDFREIEKDRRFISLDNDDKLHLEELKAKIQFRKRIDKIKELWESNEFLAKINIDSILKNGRLNAKNCKNVIISLSNLKGILPSVDKDIPLISILQAFFVKEIEMGYGLNINSLNYGIKLLKANFDDIIANKKNDEIDENIKDQILNQNKLCQNIDSISKKINDILSKSNKKLIFQLAEFLNKLSDDARDNIGEDIDNFNIEFTNIIEEYCVLFFENEITISEKLTFMWNYYKNFKLILEDIKEYSEKEVWDNFEMEIKK